MLKTWQCGAMMRFYLYVQIIISNAIGYNEQRSLIYRLSESAGAVGWFVLAFMTLLALFGLIDAIINDVMPRRFMLLTGLELRHWVLIGLTLCYAMQMWFSATIDSHTVIALYILNIVALFVSAVIDLKQRYVYNRRKGDFHAPV